MFEGKMEGAFFAKLGAFHLPHSAMNPQRSPLHISVVIFPGVSATAAVGACDVLNSAGTLQAAFGSEEEDRLHFSAELVGPQRGLIDCASGVTLRAARGCAAVTATDIVYVPGVMLPPDGIERAATRPLLAWLRARHAAGALICSSCSGSYVLAATGLLDGLEATTHWAYAADFARYFPRVALAAQKILVDAGPRHRIVTAGGGGSWQDLVLYLVGRFASLACAQQMARVFLLQWHPDGQSTFACLRPQLRHNDAAVRRAQEILQRRLTAQNVLVEAEQAAQLPRRTYQRRFKQATGFAPVSYLQLQRVEKAKELLATSPRPADDIAEDVGYLDPVSFRRVFRRLVGVPPGEYRRRHHIPRPAGRGAPEVGRVVSGQPKGGSSHSAKG